MVQSVCHIYTGYIPVALKPLLIFIAVKAFLSPRETHLAKMSFFAPCPLLLIVHMSRHTLKACLKDLKQLTSRGYRA